MKINREIKRICIVVLAFAGISGVAAATPITDGGHGYVVSGSGACAGAAEAGYCADNTKSRKNGKRGSRRGSRGDPRVGDASGFRREGSEAPVAVAEPGTVGLLGLGLVGLAFGLRNRR